MKFFSYLKYFFYLSVNWNIKIAWHILRQEINGEKKYGINTTGADELKSIEKKGIDIDHATIYMPISYQLLDDLFIQLSRLNLNTKKHFLDIGCGKGRALCVAASKGFSKVTGIDFCKEFCDDAKNNLAMVKQKYPTLNYNIINNNAFYYDIPNDVDCIFLFNPFDAIIMEEVANNIKKNSQEFPRNIIIFYANPLHKELFFSIGFNEIYHTKKMEYLEASILYKEASTKNN